MDTGEGRFEGIHSTEDFQTQVDELRKKYPKSKGVFTVGEVLEIRESRFRVADISPWGIKLKLLKAEGPEPLPEPNENNETI